MEEAEAQPPKNPNSLTNLHTNLITNDEDDEPPTLSSHALLALKEFLAEQSHSAAAVGDDEDDQGVRDSTVALVSEDWRLSQFWYDRVTAETLAGEILSLRPPSESEPPRIACIACPTLYAYLKNVDSDARVQILEYDKRFEQYGDDFTFYDYNQPHELPLSLKHQFHVVVADPPYLSQECLEKVAQTISFLSRSADSYVVLLTGDVQRDRAAELMGLRPCGFRPRHTSKLGNEFRIFTNYDPESRLGGWDREE